MKDNLAPEVVANVKNKCLIENLLDEVIRDVISDGELDAFMDVV
jgi:hypothetical protein